MYRHTLFHFDLFAAVEFPSFQDMLAGFNSSFSGRFQVALGRFRIHLPQAGYHWIGEGLDCSLGILLGSLLNRQWFPEPSRGRLPRGT